MAKGKTKSAIITANETYLNWQCFSEKKPCSAVVEARLYTDAWILGELPDLGPYSFLNTVAAPTRKNLRPAVVLRVALHIPTRRPPLPMVDDFDHYHGGDFIDEMAALTSLFLGIRMQAGPIDREFVSTGDPLGRPIQYGSKAVPTLPEPYQAPQIPRLFTDRNLFNLKSLENFSERRIDEANALIKAARMYQQAVWISDADPALAWLLLISAVETAAVLWAGNVDTPRERLKAALPQLHKLLEVNDYKDLIDPIAEILSVYTRATKKFIDFLTKFVPDPPSDRPTEFLQFSFSPKHMKAAANLIYSHRSKSLHSGTAFPLPMCIPPKLYSFEGVQDAAYQEVPTGLAMNSRSATWERTQTPMLLHVFEYLARGAILNWWQSFRQNSNGAVIKPA
jgi:hypothetical protein